MKTRKKTAKKKRLTLAQQVARLKAANDRMEARLKATRQTPEEWWCATCAEVWAPLLRRTKGSK